MVRKLVGVVAIVALSTALARAQVTGPIPNTGYDTGPTWNMWPTERSQSPAEVRRDYEIEQQYRETLKTKIPDRKASNDPWRNIRPAAATQYDKHRVD